MRIDCWALEPGATWYQRPTISVKSCLFWSGNNASINGATYGEHLRSLESVVAPGRTLGEIQDAQTAHGNFVKGFLPRSAVVDGVSGLQKGSIVAAVSGKGGAVAPERAAYMNEILNRWR